MKGGPFIKKKAANYSAILRSLFSNLIVKVV